MPSRRAFARSMTCGLLLACRAPAAPSPPEPAGARAELAEPAGEDPAPTGPEVAPRCEAPRIPGPTIAAADAGATPVDEPPGCPQFAPEPRCPKVARQSVGAPDFSRLNADLQRAFEERELPSFALAVFYEGRVVWERAYGFADLRRKRRATPHTPYSLASVSKMYTGAALMLAVEDGRLRLDEGFNEVVGEPLLVDAEGVPVEVSLAQLAHHLGGADLYFNFYDPGELPEGGAWATTRAWGVLALAPGERYSYSNRGYGLLGLALEARGGASLDAIFAETIFEPLGLDDTYLRHPRTGSRRAAIRYGGLGRPLPLYQTDHPGASEVWASAHDLARFLGWQLGEVEPALLSEASRARLHRGTKGAWSYGLGVASRRQEGLQVLAHSGGMPGARALAVAWPEEGLALAMLVNSGGEQGIFELTRKRVLDEFEVRSRSDHLCGARPGEHPSDPLMLPLHGRWEGSLALSEGPRPLRLELFEDGRALVTLGEERVSAWELELDTKTLAFELWPQLPMAGREARVVRVQMVFPRDAEAGDDELRGVARVHSHGRAARAFPLRLERRDDVGAGS